VTLYVAGASAVAVAIAVLGLGLFAMGMAPSMQYRVVSLAGQGSELAQSLPASAAGLGTALGSFAGGVAIGGYTPRAAVITGLAIALIGIPTAWAASYLRPPANQEGTRPAPAELPASHA
jgi:DHA1 family inner membrane transport protein